MMRASASLGARNGAVGAMLGGACETARGVGNPVKRRLSRVHRCVALTLWTLLFTLCDFNLTSTVP